MIYISGQLFKHLLNTSSHHKEISINSVVKLFDNYIHWISSNIPFATGINIYYNGLRLILSIKQWIIDLQKYTLSYILSLPKVSPVLLEGTIHALSSSPPNPFHFDY